jgi:hypothetical protein
LRARVHFLCILSGANQTSLLRLPSFGYTPARAACLVGCSGEGEQDRMTETERTMGTRPNHSLGINRILTKLFSGTGTALPLGIFWRLFYCLTHYTDSMDPPILSYSQRVHPLHMCDFQPMLSLHMHMHEGKSLFFYNTPSLFVGQIFKFC